MGLNFHPARGTILICDFAGFRIPEMVKIRPVIIISPRRRRGTGLATIVPLSSGKPEPVEPWHYRLANDAYPPARGEIWAKCDMVATVSLDRLDRIKVRQQNGSRTYVTYQMIDNEMVAVFNALRAGLDIG